VRCSCSSGGGVAVDSGGEKWEAEKENQERPEERHHYLPLGNGVELNRLSPHVTGAWESFLVYCNEGGIRRTGARRQQRQGQASVSSVVTIVIVTWDPSLSL
jgi:hypothetical protein